MTSTIATCTNTSHGSAVRPATGSTSTPTSARGPGGIPAAMPGPAAVGSPLAAAAAAAVPHAAAEKPESETAAGRTAAALQRKRLIADATKEQHMAWAERRLDALGDQLLLQRFVMLGPHERRRGGMTRL